MTSDLLTQFHNLTGMSKDELERKFELIRSSAETIETIKASRADALVLIEQKLLSRLLSPDLLYNPETNVRDIAYALKVVGEREVELNGGSKSTIEIKGLIAHIVAASSKEVKPEAAVIIEQPAQETTIPNFLKEK